MRIPVSGRPRSRLSGALVLVAIFVSCAACKLNSTAGSQAEAGKTDSSPRSTHAAQASAASSASSAGSTATVDIVLYSNSGLTVTLTTIAVGPVGRVTADVTYQNTGSASIELECGGLSASLDTLTPASGPAIPATHSYCSDHPAASLTIAAGGTLASYAIFDGVDAAAGPFSFTWQGNTQISGSVAGIAIP